MILLELFLTFFKIGAFSFGGGYAMISLISDSVTSHGWMTEEEMLRFIAVAESTPGPIAVNLATFIGFSQGKLAGALSATLGVVLPSFVIILIIASILKNFLQYKSVNAVLKAIRPAIAAIIVSTALNLALKILFNVHAVESTFNVDFKSLLVFATVVILSFAYKKIFKKAVSPILLIVILGIMGIGLFM